MHFSTHNTKLRKTIKLIKEDPALKKILPHKYLVWGIPAFKDHVENFVTCPGAGSCSGPCFARSGHYTFPRRKQIERDNLLSARRPMFKYDMNNRLQSLSQPHLIRIHDSGDFFNRDYFLDWLWVAKNNKRHKFYAYTKSWIETHLWRQHGTRGMMANLSLVYSLGGLYDQELLDWNENAKHTGIKTLPVSEIFLNKETANLSGYPACDTDIEAILEEPRIGLIYHNNKHPRRFKWNKAGSLFNAAVFTHKRHNHFKETNVQ